MDSNNLQASVSLNTTPQKALDAIGNVTAWWATNVKGNSTGLGDIFTVRFGKTFSNLRIIEWVPARKVVWLVTDCDLPLFKNRSEWKNTQIVWEVSPGSDGVKIVMTHVGLTPACECYNDCQKGWGFYVKESLGKLITDGNGLPGTGIFSYILSGDRRYEGLLYFKNDPLPEYPDGFIFLDVQQTSGEEVTSVYSTAAYNKEKFNADALQGEYFMVIQNKPGKEGMVFFDDLKEKIKGSFNQR